MRLSVKVMAARVLEATRSVPSLILPDIVLRVTALETTVPEALSIVKTPRKVVVPVTAKAPATLVVALPLPKVIVPVVMAVPREMEPAIWAVPMAIVVVPEPIPKLSVLAAELEPTVSVPVCAVPPKTTVPLVKDGPKEKAEAAPKSTVKAPSLLTLVAPKVKAA